MYIYTYTYIHIYKYMYICMFACQHMNKRRVGWLRSVGSIKSQMSFAEYRLFYRSLLQKRLIILRSLLIVAIPYIYMQIEMYVHMHRALTRYTYIHRIPRQAVFRHSVLCMYMYMYICMYTHTALPRHIHIYICIYMIMCLGSVVCVYIHIYIYIYAHTYTYTYMHIHTQD